MAARVSDWSFSNSPACRPAIRARPALRRPGPVRCRSARSGDASHRHTRNAHPRISPRRPPLSLARGLRGRGPHHRRGPRDPAGGTGRGPSPPLLRPGLPKRERPRRPVTPRKRPDGQLSALCHTPRNAPGGVSVSELVLNYEQSTLLPSHAVRFRRAARHVAP